MTADLVAASSFSVRLFEDDWTRFSSSVALKDVPSAGVHGNLVRKNWKATAVLFLLYTCSLDPFLW